MQHYLPWDVMVDDTSTRQISTTDGALKSYKFKVYLDVISIYMAFVNRTTTFRIFMEN